MFRTKHATLAMAISSALALSACGGDSGAVGGGNEGVVQPGGVIITGIDGYLKNALLCADDNNNGKCEAGEVIKDLKGNVLLTDENGHIDAKISQADEKRLDTSPRLIATIQSLDSDAELFTEDTDMPGQAMKAVVLRTPAGSEIASPMTDLVVSKMQATEGLSEVDAKKEVLASMEGLDSATAMDENVLFGDYIVAKTAGDDASKALAVKIHKTAQILTETKANASSDEAFDAQLDQVVNATVDATANMSDKDLADETYKPYVPVEKEPTPEPPVVVYNYVAKFNALNVTALANKVESLKDIYGDVDMWGEDKVIANVSVASLVTDVDAETLGKSNTISIANDKALQSKNLKVTLTDSTLVIARVDSTKAVSAGTYKIQLSTNDLNSKGEMVLVNGKPSLITSSTTLNLTVKSYNYAPTLNNDVATNIGATVKAIKLEQGVEVNKQFDLDGLFSDKNGDALVYTAKSTIAGVTAKMAGDVVVLTGAPIGAPTDGKLDISVTDGVNTAVKHQFSFAPVTPAINTELRDMLVGADKTWYRWNRESEQLVNNNWRHYANCMGIKFIEGDNNLSGTVQLGEGEAQCPQESEIVKQDGTWKLNQQGHIEWALPGEGTLTLTQYTGDHSQDARQPRIIVIGQQEVGAVSRTEAGQAMLNVTTVESGMTFFNGLESATNYWNDAEGSVWLGKEVNISARSRHGQFTANEKQDHIDVDLFFENTLCEDLGFKADPDNTQNNGFIPADLRADYFRLIGEGTNGANFDFGMENWMHKPYAFQDIDVDGSHCAVNLDVRKDQATASNFQSGQALTIYVSEKANSGDEEFIINTFIDRDFSIEPKHDLIIDENGIYFVDGMTVGYLSVFNGEIIEEFSDYTSTGWTEWAKFEGEQKITAYQAMNGNHAYQFWNKGDSYNGDESFTIWADTAGMMSMQDAGSAEVWTQKYFTSETEAKEAVEAVAAKSISFVGSTWRETFVTGGESSEYSDYAYTVDGYTVTSSPAAEYDGFYAWENSPLNDLPCMYEGNHTCTYEELNKSYPWEGTWVKWEWNPITDTNKMWRHKGQHESEWVRIK